MLLPEFE